MTVRFEMKALFLKITLVTVLLSLAVSVGAATNVPHPILQLVDEQLNYDISFLWFERLAEGSIRLENGPETGTFLVTMEARTLGLAAFFTRNRIEQHQTLMRIGGNGLLEPLWYRSRSRRDSGSDHKEMLKEMVFDYDNGRMHFRKIKNGRLSDRRSFELKPDQPHYDVLSALYNLRLGFFGEVGLKTISIPTFHSHGPEEIIVEPLDPEVKDNRFFAPAPVRVKILVDPEVFDTDGRDILAAFDGLMRPSKGIIKDVIGLGDVRGVLRSSP